MSEVRPPFFLQVADEHGAIVRLRAGGKLERDLIEVIVAQVATKPVGVFTTKARVLTAIREGITQALRELKQDTVRVW